MLCAAGDAGVPLPDQPCLSVISSPVRARLYINCLASAPHALRPSLSFVPLPVPVSLQTASHKAPGLAEIRRQKEDDREEEMAGCDGAKSSASMEEEEACVEKKYGGIAPKKPLISKDHERAYFDSADWVLGKQAANSTTRAAVESLKPKLKRTPHHQLPPRKPTCASS